MAFTRAVGGSSPEFGVRVVGVNPGPVLTDRIEFLGRKRAATLFGDENRWRESFAKMPFGRPASCDEIAATVRLPRLRSLLLYQRHHCHHRRRPQPIAASCRNVFVISDRRVAAASRIHKPGAKKVTGSKNPLDWWLWNSRFAPTARPGMTV